VTAFLLSLRERNHPQDEAWHAELKNFRKLLATLVVHGGGVLARWALGDVVATILFAFIAFFASARVQSRSRRRAAATTAR
jgi:phosphatidate cytidylyltransferase